MNWERIAAFVAQPATLWDCIVAVIIAVAIAVSLASFVE